MSICRAGDALQTSLWPNAISDDATYPPTYTVYACRLAGNITMLRIVAGSMGIGARVCLGRSCSTRIWQEHSIMRRLPSWFRLLVVCPR
jgi:hypothetical protein